MPAVAGCPVDGPPGTDTNTGGDTGGDTGGNTGGDTGGDTGGNTGGTSSSSDPFNKSSPSGKYRNSGFLVLTPCLVTPFLPHVWGVTKVDTVESRYNAVIFVF